MEFKEFNNVFANKFKKLSEDATHLFEVNLDKDELWNIYLDSFPEGTNPIFRERRSFDCSCCRNFIRRMGCAVFIIDRKIKTIWDFEVDSNMYQPVIDAMNEYVLEHGVSDIYVPDSQKIGVNNNLEETDDNGIYTWYHFYLELPNKFMQDRGRSDGDIKNDYRTKKEVFKRSLDEITEESVVTILELIKSNTLYKGDEWEYALKEFLSFKREYKLIESDNEKDLYVWTTSVSIGPVVSKIRNHSIGTLLVNVSEGMSLDTAVSKYEDIVAPSNYKRTNAIYTKQMLDNAKNALDEAGYLSALQRRYANVDDIGINDILFANRDIKNQLEGNIFDEMENEITNSVRKFSTVEEVSIDNFLENILPDVTEIELMMDNTLTNNLVSLITADDETAKSMFKWDNTFSWAYTGNITDSSMKDRVKNAGGDVTGDLRFSIQWNEEGNDDNDLDAHAIEISDKYEIYFGNRRNISPNGGKLDVDIQSPMRNIQNDVAVENITYKTRDRMKDGVYQFYVNTYAHRGGLGGFRAEIEFDGEIYEFDYNKNLRTGQRVHVANVVLKNGKFTIDTKLPSGKSTKEVWGITTNNFIPVTAVMFSPNHWEREEGIGHKHLFFMLQDCVNNESPSSFYNEFLESGLRDHRKFLEALGNKMVVKDVDRQMSGVGFSMTRRNEVVLKVKANTERVIRVKF